jgi:hypothetical protein
MSTFLICYDLSFFWLPLWIESMSQPNRGHYSCPPLNQRTELNKALKQAAPIMLVLMGMYLSKPKGKVNQPAYQENKP